MRTFRLIVFLLVSFTFSTYGQLIGNGQEEGPTLSNVNINSKALLSGLYTGYNCTNLFPDQNNPQLQHVFIMRHYNMSNNNQLQIVGNFNTNDRLFFRKISTLTLTNYPDQVWNEFATRGVNTFSGNQIINGNIGIGTPLPGAKLEVGVPNDFNQSGGIRIGSISVIGGNNVFFGIGMNYRLDSNKYPTGSLTVYQNGIQTDAIYFDVMNGHVGIGTSKLQSDSYLTVKGKISAEDIEVKDVNADYVFEKGYKLNSLEEVETYINANQHLPGIAPASETAKGVDLGKFNSLLLQKVEELTLYTIQLKKEIDELKKNQ